MKTSVQTSLRGRAGWLIGLLLAGTVVPSALAGSRTSLNYSITADTLDSGGGATVSAAYANNGSVGLVAGLATAAASGATLKSGYIGQIADDLSLNVTAQHALVGTGYVAGGSVTISNTITYSGALSSLQWDVLLPAGWSYTSGSGSEGTVKPAVGATGLLTWQWTTIPASPVAFGYTLTVPAGQTGDKQLAGLVTAAQGGPSSQFLALPDPLVVPEGITHSGDTDRNFRISLLELTRVIELYNTRNGTTRTGCYKVLDGTEDGFAPDPTRASSTVVTLTRYHSGDSSRDGKLSLLELTRVIELYNYRAGTTRTGQYHVQAGTEDGFAPGP